MGEPQIIMYKVMFFHIYVNVPPNIVAAVLCVYIYICMGVSINEGFQNGWFIMENPKIKWMIWGPYIYIRIYIYS
jgi:hypothetical protein